MRLGSVCTGIGGLDIAVEAHFGAELVWCAEIDVAASRVLEVRWPGVPNVGDFRAVTPPDVDVLCGGFPCQPVSAAGKRAGTEDERWLFDDICDLVGRMGARPRVLVFENVAGLLTANDGDAMARVVHGLAALGYVGSWRSVRAADAGACHRRERVFIVAADADSAGTGWDRGAVPRQDQGARRSRVNVRAAVDARADAPAHPENIGRAWPGASRHGRCRPADRGFGPYAPAIARWERVVGRTAPSPVDDRGRLSPLFVEWMMGFPAGWCTDVLDRRTDALRCLGNAVVPQQAAVALEVCGG